MMYTKQAKHNNTTTTKKTNVFQTQTFEELKKEN